MYTELECAICYLSFNAGRRCPRELHCNHTFCESCLLALARDRAIVCPLCRHTTSLSGEHIRAELRVDECVLEQLLLTGLLLEAEEDQEEDREEDREEGSQDPETQGAPSGSEDRSEGFGRGRLRRTLRKVWKKISGKNSAQTGNDISDMSSDDMRSFALMACYMF